MSTRRPSAGIIALPPWAFRRPKNDRATEWHPWRCANCGHVRWQPLPDAADGFPECTECDDCDVMELVPMREAMGMVPGEVAGT